MTQAINLEVLDTAESVLAGHSGVQGVRSVRMRWIGHRLHADAELDVDPTLSLAAAHRIAHDSEHDLIHALPKLSSAMIHAYPAHENGTAKTRLVHSDS